MAIWSWWRATVICLDLRIENRTFVLLLLLIPLWTFAEFNWSETRFRSLTLGKHNPKNQTDCKKGLLPFWVPFPLFLQLLFIFIEKLQCCRFHLPKIIRTKPSLTDEAPLRKPLLLLSDADQQIFSCDAWLPTSASHTSACMPFGKIRPTFQQVTTGSTFNRIDLHIWAYPILLLPIYL